MATKKDYEVISQLINDLTDSEGKLDKDDLVEKLSDYFEKDNPRFNKDLFNKACYKDPNKRKVLYGTIDQPF